MPFNQKLVAAVLANVFTFAVAYLVVKFGIKESPQVALQVAAGVGVLSSAVAGWLVRVVPTFPLDVITSIVKDATDALEGRVGAVETRQNAQATVVHSQTASIDALTLTVKAALTPANVAKAVKAANVTGGRQVK